MNAFDITVPLGLGLLSSLHCAQMCGPVVVAYGIPLRGSRRENITGHLLYNAGRLLTYSLLGAIAGAVGTGLTRLAGLEQTATLVTGALMIVAALAMSGWAPASSLVTIGKLPGSRGVGRLILSARAANKFWLGLVFGFLPCGLVYGALLKAVETGSAAGGAVTMLAFGTGTASALLGIGLFSSVMGRGLGAWTARLAPATIGLLGAFLIYRALVMPAACHHGSV